MEDNMCFCCSDKNPIGLHLKFWFEGDTIYTEFVPCEEHQSYNGVFHGGLTGTILDELMGKYLNARGIKGFTGRLTIRYKVPLRIGQKIRFACKMVDNKSRFYKMKAWAELPGGEIAAEATGHMMKVT